jgi:hypothetical protein
MASISAQWAALARKVTSPGSSSIRTTRTPKMSLHQVTIAAADTATNTVHVQFNGSTDVTEGIRVIQPYTDSNPAQAGDIAWGIHHGTDFVVFGRHVIPNSTVILP